MSHRQTDSRTNRQTNTYVYIGGCVLSSLVPLSGTRSKDVSNYGLSDPNNVTQIKKTDGQTNKHSRMHIGSGGWVLFPLLLPFWGLDQKILAKKGMTDTQTDTLTETQTNAHDMRFTFPFF